MQKADDDVVKLWHNDRCIAVRQSDDHHLNLRGHKSDIIDILTS